MASNSATAKYEVSDESGSESNDTQLSSELLEKSKHKINIENVDTFLDDVEDLAKQLDKAVDERAKETTSKRKVKIEKDAINMNDVIPDTETKKKNSKRQKREVTILTSPNEKESPIVLATNIKSLNPIARTPLLKLNKKLLEVQTNSSGAITAYCFHCWCGIPMKKKNDSYVCGNAGKGNACRFSIMQKAVDLLFSMSLINIESCKKGYPPLPWCDQCKSIRISAGTEKFYPGGILFWCGCQQSNDKIKCVMATGGKTDAVLKEMLEVKNPETKQPYWQNVPASTSIYFSVILF